MQPLISIIMGAYNEEDHISRCIDSIINQTYENWEFIICNDCSKDRTLDILNSYSKRDKRIIIISNETNLRLGASLNKCLEIARGNYIARMDADDESLPFRLEKQLQFLESNPEVDCVGCARFIFDNDGIIGIRREREYPNSNDLLKTTAFAHPTIMMRANVYRALGGYSTSVETMRAEDLDLWFRFFEKGYIGYNIQEPLYKYREGLPDLSKRTLGAAYQTSKVYWKGYKRIGIPVYKRAYALKPFISALLPNRLLFRYHKYILNNNRKKGTK